MVNLRREIAGWEYDSFTSFSTMKCSLIHPAFSGRTKEECTFRKSLQRLENHLHKAVLLDRDGVINYDPGTYTTCLADFKLLPTVTEALKILHDSGHLLIVITNQGGIAKGLYGHDAVAEMHAFLKKQCETAGAPLTDVFYSPHHQDFGKSLARKPGSLLVERALARYAIDPQRACMVGDKARDIEAAEKAGVRGVQIPTNAPLIDYVELLASN